MTPEEFAEIRDAVEALEDSDAGSPFKTDQGDVLDAEGQVIATFHAEGVAESYVTVRELLPLLIRSYEGLELEVRAVENDLLDALDQMEEMA